MTPFKIKIIEKPHIFLLPDLYFSVATRILKFSDICVSWTFPKKCPADKFFKIGK